MKAVLIVLMLAMLMSGTASAWDDATFADPNPKDAIGYRFNLSNMSLEDQCDSMYPISDKSSGEYRLWYVRSDGQEMVATSTDCLTFNAVLASEHYIPSRSDDILADTEEPSQTQEFYDGMITYIWEALMYDYKL